MSSTNPRHRTPETYERVTSSGVSHSPAYPSSYIRPIIQPPEGLQCQWIVLSATTDRSIPGSGRLSARPRLERSPCITDFLAQEPTYLSQKVSARDESRSKSLLAGMAQQHGHGWTTYNIENNDFRPPEDIYEHFSLISAPDRQIWRLVRTSDKFTAPMLLKKLDGPFMIAEATVTVELEMEWDQAGLVLFHDMSPTEPWICTTSLEGRRRRFGSSTSHGKWVTVSLQMQDNEVGVGVAVTYPDRGPDLSFTAVCAANIDHLGYTQGFASLRLKLEHVNDMLWISYMVPDGHDHDQLSVSEIVASWKKIREVTGFFGEAGVKPSVHVGCYTSRPLDMDEDDQLNLTAEFEHLELLGG